MFHTYIIYSTTRFCSSGSSQGISQIALSFLSLMTDTTTTTTVNRRYVPYPCSSAAAAAGGHPTVASSRIHKSSVLASFISKGAALPRHTRSSSFHLPSPTVVTQLIPPPAHRGAFTHLETINNIPCIEPLVQPRPPSFVSFRSAAGRPTPRCSSLKAARRRGSRRAPASRPRAPCGFL